MTEVPTKPDDRPAKILAIRKCHHVVETISTMMAYRCKRLHVQSKVAGYTRTMSFNKVRIQRLNRNPKRFAVIGEIAWVTTWATNLSAPQRPT